jgi:hypothetical protein
MGKEYQVSVLRKNLLKGPHSFMRLAMCAQGLYPSDLATLLKEEVLSGGILFREGKYGLPSLGAPKGLGSAGNLLELPEPHPLDYDWRFTADTTERMALRILSETPGAGHIALVGTPSLINKIPHGRSDCRVTLVDGNEELVTYLARQQQHPGLTCKYVDLTLGPAKLDEPSNVVMCDPPWYVEYYAAFLAQAAVIAEIGATVFISLLPLCTRPESERDRQEIFNIAGSLGLTPYALEPGVLVYDIPPFERKSLALEGLSVTEAWRRGDLLVLQKVSAPTEQDMRRALERSNLAREDRRQWREVLIGARKIKLRRAADDSNGRPELVRIERDDLLPTVSRRYPGRERVDLWLWDNRVFGVTNGRAFWKALQIAAGRDSLESALHRRHVEIALEHVRSLLA